MGLLVVVLVVVVVVVAVAVGVGVGFGDVLLVRLWFDKGELTNLVLLIIVEVATLHRVDAVVVHTFCSLAESESKKLKV